jgi:hypothetical protein
MKKYIMTAALALVLSVATFAGAQAMAICASGQYWSGVRCEAIKSRVLDNNNTQAGVVSGQVGSTHVYADNPSVAGRMIVEKPKPGPVGIGTVQGVASQASAVVPNSGPAPAGRVVNTKGFVPGKVSDQRDSAYGN